MSIQNRGIRIPQRIAISNPFVSRPIAPIPFPVQNRSNNYPPLSQPLYLQPMQQPSNQINVVRSNSPPLRNTNIIQAPNLYQTNSPVHASLNSQPNRQHINIAHAYSNKIVQSMQPPQIQMISSSIQRQQSPKMRPASPKVQFRYASPAKPNNNQPQIKQNSNSNSFQVLSSINEDQLRSFNSNPKQSIPKDQHKQEHTIIKQIDSQNKIFSSPQNPQQKNLISNYIYMIDNQHVIKDQPEQNHPPQPLFSMPSAVYQNRPIQSSQSINKQQQKINQSSNVSLANLLQKQMSNQQNKKQNGKQSQNGSSGHFFNELEIARIEDSKIKNKGHDQELKSMMEQYQNLRNGDGRDEELPRVQKNSSDQNQQSQDSKINKQSRSKLSTQKNGTHMANNQKQSNKNVNSKNEQQLATFGYLPDNKLPMRIIDQPSKTQGKNAQKKELVRKKPIYQQSDYFLIEGVENVKSEVYDGALHFNERNDKNVKMLKLNSNSNNIKQQEQQENEMKDAQFNVRLKQKDLQIKNLKNQVWLMKLKQNELLSTIKRLEKANKDQLNIINSFKNKQ